MVTLIFTQNSLNIPDLRSFSIPTLLQLISFNSCEYRIQNSAVTGQRRLELDLSVVEVNCSLKATFQLTNDADFEMATTTTTSSQPTLTLINDFLLLHLVRGMLLLARW